MSETYDATYAAVRSKIGHCDIGEAVANVVRDSGISHAVACIQSTMQEMALEYGRPSVMLKPKVYQDGNQWCVLYGEDLVCGIAGFGNSPHLAMINFDTNYYAVLNKPEQSRES